MRIRTLEIRDFKAFCGTHTINLTNSCKNLLVLGENGSGKTSLVRALEGALDSSRKTVRFEKNIFAEPGSGFVRVTLDNGGVLIWQENGISGGNAQHATTFSDAAKAKRLMDYKGLLKTYLLEGETVNVFDLLVHEILADVINPFTNMGFQDNWRMLEKLIPKRNIPKQIAALAEPLKLFNDGLMEILKRLVVHARDILKEFDEALEFDLQFKGVLYEAASKSLKQQEAWLTTRFHGRDLTRHHHLLNEARLSSIAISLYFAALLETPPSDLRVLMLDDMLIGLDMENRMPVLDLLNRPEFRDYQIFMLTYDPIWYDIVRQKVSAGTWKWIEMRRPLEVSSEIPIVDGGDFFAVAKSHLQAGDLRSGANYTRSAFEHSLQKFCKDLDVPIKFRPRIKDYSSDDFWKAILEWQKTCSLGTVIDQELQRKTELMRSIILNPLSHSQILTLQLREVKKAFEVVESLDQALKAAKQADEQAKLAKQIAKATGGGNAAS